MTAAEPNEDGYIRTEALRNGWKLREYESKATDARTRSHWGKPTNFAGTGFDVFRPDGSRAGSRAFRVEALQLLWKPGES